ncbi:MAG TPA: UDP-N-acetylmuramate--L-alanine ligase, partial [Anaerolineales bacterium]
MTHVHLIGIGGSGLSAIARLLMESGYEVTGSDLTLSAFARDLQSLGLKVSLGHDAANIKGADWVVRSSAIPDENPEVQAARQAGLPIFKRADFLGKLMADKMGIAVAGTHGKTTTTAMIAWILSVLGRDPSFLVGGTMVNYGVNARAGKGEAFVIEADEYDRTFLGLQPRIEVITNVEHDHPDCYPTFEDMLKAFELFVERLPQDGTLVASAEDEGSSALLSRARRSGRSVVAYTLRGEMTINAPHWMQAESLSTNARGGYSFTAITNISRSESNPVSVELQVPGEHNVRNALAALSVMAVMGLSLKNAAAALGEFRGTGRRFQVLGEKHGIVVVDDYAHHPTEIRATLSAARARYPGRRMWAVWQPHTYSRTKALFLEFTRAFADADQVLVTEVYPSREPKQDFSSAEVVSAMAHPAARYSGSLE